MKSKWLKNQIKRHQALRRIPMTKRSATENQTAVCMILFVVIIVGLIVKEVWF